MSAAAADPAGVNGPAGQVTPVIHRRRFHGLRESVDRFSTRTDGLIGLAILLVFRSRMMRQPTLRKVWPIGLTMAMSMIFFGVLFAEAFGETAQHLLHVEPILFDRAEPAAAFVVDPGLCELGAITPPPGWVPAPHRYSACRGVW